MRNWGALAHRQDLIPPGRRAVGFDFLQFSLEIDERQLDGTHLAAEFRHFVREAHYVVAQSCDQQGQLGEILGGTPGRESVGVSFQLDEGRHKLTLRRG